MEELINIEHLSDFDIYKEVPAGGIVDIVAVKDKIRIGIEVKVALNFDVIWQAYRSVPMFHYCYAAVPVRGKHYSSLHPAQIALCEYFGIGVLGYIDKSHKLWSGESKFEMVDAYEIKEFIKPKLNRHPKKIELHDYMKRSVAGSQNNRITAFGYFVECVENVLKAGRMVNGLRRSQADIDNGLTPKELFESLSLKHYKTLSVFKNSLVRYCNSGVIKTVEWDGERFRAKQKQ